MSFDPVSFAMGAKSGGGGGSSGGVLVVHANADTGALDKTWQEIADAPIAVLKTSDTTFSVINLPIVACGSSDRGYAVLVAYLIYNTTPFEFEPVYFVTDSANGYPVAQGG